MAARLDMLPALLAQAFKILQTAPVIGTDFHWFAYRENGWLSHPGDVPGFSCWSGFHADSRRSVTVAAGLSWVPDMGNPAELLAKDLIHRPKGAH